MYGRLGYYYHQAQDQIRQGQADTSAARAPVRTKVATANTRSRSAWIGLGALIGALGSAGIFAWFVGL
ncbi:hypothetical protein CG50_05425 [Paenirhodobacter enshiensis]|jgi:hypothetical protein|uniref:Uncharacterized protein n=1 Tax=Paenirhodobacter enshiensis TaxID=1105367 RepID=A0A086XTT6_9RHOB|nr:hypothetical protein CG50_05425 [Paenirhodobacter enshiensis]